MMFEFTTKDGKKPDPDVVPTRISVGGREYDVKDYCVEAPAKFEPELASHGFRQRQRQTVQVDPTKAK